MTTNLRNNEGDLNLDEIAAKDDILKFILILISLISIIILGLNKVLNNETISALLGGLIGSLLTMRGSYTDLKPLSKKEMEELNPQQGTVK